MLRITRKSLRAYIFLVVFACTFVGFTLAPISIIHEISTPLATNFTSYLPLAYQAHWHAPIPPPQVEFNAWDLESVTLYPERPPQRPPHTFRPDGLLQVNPGGRHPILDLIQRAEQQWDVKLASASKSLPEAIREYHRRYTRAPPPGFDRWWAYVQKHNVQLPDEYDQINKDLSPFWGIHPVRLQSIQRDWEGHEHSYTLAKTTPLGPFHVGNETLPQDEAARQRLLIGANQLIDLLSEIEHDLPLFRAVFSPHDNPNVFLTHEMRRNVIEAGEKGDPIDFLSSDPAPYIRGWEHACPFDSPARNPPFPPTTPAPKTFIHNHLAAMNPCAHPTHLTQHGQFLSHGIGPAAHPFPVPQFSYCSSPLHADIRVPIPLSWVEEVEGGDGEWEGREEERLLWRGMNTGIYHAGHTPWKASQRDRLMDLVEGSGLSGIRTLEVLLMDAEGDGEGMKMEQVKKARMDPAMLDIAFAGNPGQCEEETCRELGERWEWRRRMSVREAGRYKYVLDVDGNGWSSRFKRLMTSGSLVFKSTVYPEWFTDRLSPWVHYIPIQIDYSDLYDALSFFRGDLSGRGAHEDLAKKIAGRGREWSKQFWRKEDMVAYLFRLFLEYARVMSEDRDELNFKL